MKKLSSVVILGMFGAILLVGPAQALRITYFGEDSGLGDSTPLATWPNAAAAQADFLAGLTGVGTEDFEGFGPGNVAPLALAFPGAGTATLQGDGYISNVPGSGRYATSGVQYWQTSGRSSFSIGFGDPVAAFGFYGIDVGDVAGQLTLTLVNGGTETINIPHTADAPGGSVLYFGIIDTEVLFTNIAFGNTGSLDDYFGFDDMTIASPGQVTVPDASSLFLLGSACVIGFWTPRRRSRN